MASENTAGNEVFRRSSMNRIASADDLDHYIKVTNPSAWVITLAAFLLIVGVIVWAVIAIVPVTVNTTGITAEGKAPSDEVVICWVNKATADKVRTSGAKATIDGVEAKSVKLVDTPMSSTEVIHFLGSEFYVDALDLSDWNYMLTIAPGEEPAHTDFTIGTQTGEAYLVPVTITVSETRPINIVLGKE